MNDNKSINYYPRSNWLLLCGFICATAFSSQLFAASEKANSFEKLLSTADLVAVGKCSSISNEWRKKKIYTLATIKVDEIVKGKAATEIRVEYMGGTAIHPTLNVPIAMNVSNGVTISEGDESIFVLKKLKNDGYQVIGAARGKIPITTDKASGMKYVSSGAKRIQAKPSSKDGASVISGEQMNLQEFLTFVRSRIQLESKRSKK